MEMHEVWHGRYVPPMHGRLLRSRGPVPLASVLDERMTDITLCARCAHPIEEHHAEPVGCTHTDCDCRYFVLQRKALGL